MFWCGCSLFFFIPPLNIFLRIVLRRSSACSGLAWPCGSLAPLCFRSPPDALFSCVCPVSRLHVRRRQFPPFRQQLAASSQQRVCYSDSSAPVNCARRCSTTVLVPSCLARLRQFGSRCRHSSSLACFFLHCISSLHLFCVQPHSSIRRAFCIDCKNPEQKSPSLFLASRDCCLAAQPKSIPFFHFRYNIQPVKQALACLSPPTFIFFPPNLFVSLLFGLFFFFWASSPTCLATLHFDLNVPLRSLFSFRYSYDLIPVSTTFSFFLFSFCPRVLRTVT